MPLIEYSTQIDRRLAGSPLDPIEAQVRLRLTTASAVGATSAELAGWPTASLLSGVWIVIDPYTDECEVRRVTSVSGATVSFVAALTYEHAENDLILLAVNGEINALWFGASPSAAAATNSLAFARMIAQAKKSDNNRQMYIPGGNDPYQFDSTIVLQTIGSTYGLSLRGDGPIPRRGDIQSHGTILKYTATDATNAVELTSATAETSTRGSHLKNLMIVCDVAGGHTGAGVYSYRVGYTSNQLENVSVAYAYTGIKTIDCWGSTWSNVDVAFCATGASITGMNAGAWIGGGARSCTGDNAVVLGDNYVGNNGNSVFRFADLSFEGNAGNGIYFGYTAPWAEAPEHDGITIDNCYFEANGGPYEIKLGEDDIVGAGGKVRCRYFTIRDCQFENGIYLGDTCQYFLIGPNKFRSSDKITLGTKTSDGFGTILGPESLITSSSDAAWGNTWSINFIDSYNGAFYSKGVQGISSSKNAHTGLRTPRVASIEITAGTASWRDLAGATLLKINHSVATNLTQISNCPDHTLIMLKMQTANTTIKHNASYIVLRGSADYTPAAGEVIILISDGGVLYEVSRTAA